jgi:hypothetical protein
MNAMNITSSILRRPCLCVLAGGLVFSSAAAAEPQKVPKALPVGPNEDSRVYMIVEDPVVPEGTRIIRPQVIEQPRNVEVRPARRASSDNDDDDDDRRAPTRSPREVQVIEVVPTAPVAPEVTTGTTTTKSKTNPSSSSSKSKSKSRSRDSERGKTQYLETPEPTVQVQPPQSTETHTSTSSSKMKIESDVPREREPSVKKKASTVRTRTTDRSDDEGSKITEVQRSQEKTKASETQVQTVQENPPAAPAPVPSTASSTTVGPGRPNTTVLPVAPIPTTAETRQPLPEPLIPSRSTVTQQEKVTTQRIEDTPPPSQPAVTEAPVSRVNGDPLDTTPAPGSTPETAVNEKAPASFPKVETTTVEDPAVNGPGANANVSANVKQETQTTSSTTKTKEPATDKTAAASSKPAGTKEAPLAEKTETEGLVKSPYPPHKMIDVRGMAPGTLAKDPTTQEVFRVP